MKVLYELKNKRAAYLDAAKTALGKKDMNGYKAAMQDVDRLNVEIDAQERLDAEMGRFDEADNNMVDLAAVQAKEKNDAALENAVEKARGGNEYVRAFASALRSGATPKNGIVRAELKPLYNAMSISGGTPEGADGGFLVPVEFDSMIIRKMKEMVRLADFVNVESVNGYTGWRAVETAPSTKPLPLVGEGAQVPKNAQPSFVRVDYKVKKYGDRIQISSELLEDNTAGLLAYLSEWFAPRVVATENSLILALLDKLTGVSLTTGKELADLKTALNKGLNTAISRNSMLLCNQDSYDFMDQLEDKNGRPMLMPNPTQPDVFVFKGRRVVSMDNDLLPTVTAAGSNPPKGDYAPIYIGYLKAYATLFRRKALEFASTDVGGDAWGSASTEVRGIVRMDAQRVDETAVIKRNFFTPGA